MITAVFCLCMLTAQPDFNQIQFGQSYTSIEQIPGELMEVTYYYDNGTVRQKGFIKDNVLTGIWITYDQNGNITAKAHYTDGKKTGIWKVYNPDGDLVYKIMYKNDVKKDVRIFWNSSTEENLAAK